MFLFNIDENYQMIGRLSADNTDQEQFQPKLAI